MIEWFYILPIAACAYVYREILTEEGMVLEWLGNLINKIPSETIRKPLLACSHCVSGQMALWFFVIQYGINDMYDFMYLCMFICSTILINSFIYGIEKYKN